MMINNSALRRMAITNFNRSGPRLKKKKKKPLTRSVPYDIQETR